CVEVNTTSGVVKGLTIDVLNTSVDQFLAIPYAEPPVGVLRFAKPNAIKTQKFLAIPYAEPPVGVLRFAKPNAIKTQKYIDGTKHGKSCVQKFVAELDDFDPVRNITQSEDCLVLNVWTPTVRTGDRQKAALKPVMFWMHGGALITGSSFQWQYNGTALATNDVVIVSVNYRLGPFGFLYGDREDAPGNIGLYDMLFALNWVRENVHSFGGDRDQITIFGESAGTWAGASTLILSPLSKGLFKRAIMESGAHYYNSRDPMSKAEALTFAKQLAKSMNCTDGQKWLDCLRGIDAQALIKGYDTVVQVFPLLDTELLPLPAQKAFKLDSFNKDLDIMVGLMRNEGSSLINTLVKPNQTLKDYQDFVALIDTIYHNFDIKRVEEFYLKQSIDANNSNAILWAEYDMFGDVRISCPTYRFAKAYAQLGGAGGVYFYEQTYQRKSFLDEKVYGVTHQADVDYVFGAPLLYPTITDTTIDTQFSRQPTEP
ncbi:unnamed protein product, partial [Medioppia subpectinata]